MTNIQELAERINNHGIIYRTGSKLTHVENENSDDDFYAFYLPEKFDYVMSNDAQGKTLHGDNWEAKVFMISHLANLIAKTNPNVIEMFFAKPVFVSGECVELANYLYDNREELVNVDKTHFVRSAAGMLKGNIKRMSPDKVFNGNGSFGKELFNFLKAYQYGMAIANNDALEPVIFKTGDDLEYMKQVKQLTEYDQKVIDKLNINDKIDELNKFADNMTAKKDDTILHGIINLMILYC